MLKNTFLTLAILFATTLVTYSQETPGVTKSLSMYVCGGSGNINPDAGAILAHFGEAGLVYSQNFANAQWLSVTSTLAICTGGEGLVKGTKDGEDVWVPNGGSPVGKFTDGYLHVEFGFSPYFNLGFHSEGRLDFEGKYSLALPANQKVGFAAYMEVRPMAKLWYESVSSSADNGQMLGLMKVEVIYGVQFHPEWSYTTDVELRFNGGSKSVAKNDSAQALKESFGIRWNHMIGYSNPNGFGGYMNFRYEPTNILGAIGDTVHNIKLSAGISYAYDLSAL